MNAMNPSRITYPAKKAYNKPKLVKHGKVTRLTLKAGSLPDMTTMTNNMSA